MLQGLSLPFLETVPLESGLSYSVSLSEQGLETHSTFADIFSLEPQALTMLQHGRGDALPASGNFLPPRANAAAVETSLEELQPDLTPPGLPATSPSPVASLPPAIAPLQIAPLQVTLSSMQAAAPTAAAMPGLPDAIPAQAATLDLAGTLTRPTPALESRQLVTEPGNTRIAANNELLRPLPAVVAGAPRGAAELPVLPLSSEAVSNLLEQVAPTKRMPANSGTSRPAIETVSLPKPLPEVSTDDKLQAVKPGLHSIPVSQIPPVSPMVNNNGESLPGQQIQITPLQSAAPTIRSSADSSVSAPPTLPLIATPVSEPAWGDRVGDRLLLMANNQMQSAEIRLSPAELGPLRVRIAVDDGTATVHFHAQHAVTRDALEQALPRLRELFAENGLTLQQGDTGESDGNGVQHGKQDQDNSAALGATSGGVMGDDPLADDATNGRIAKSRSDNLVDTFA